MDAASSRDRKLRLGHSIFLSHSGAEKDFVRFLKEALSNNGYSVFFDEQSLPKGDRISMKNILAELKDVNLAVVLLSNAFFTRTRHPMSELESIVANHIQMLPIFYDFSVDEFKSKCRKREWLPTWKKWVKGKQIGKDTIKIWEDALAAVNGTNGLEYCKEATNISELRDKIVATVCQISKPDVPWSNPKHVQGTDRLCQVVSEMFLTSQQEPTCEIKSVVNDVESSPLSKQTVVGGVHGIAGIGKSTLCRALCDFFFKEFNGRVCYIELGDCSDAALCERLKFVLCWLTDCHCDQKGGLSVEQLWNMLRRSYKQLHEQNRPVFLAIDNVHIGESKDEAEKHLSCGPFPSGSKIFVTSQNADVLMNLLDQGQLDASSHSWVCGIPNLSFSEAKNIFLHSLPSRVHMTSLNNQQNRVVDECIEMCTLNKSQSDYFPMLLTLLAAYMWNTSGQDPLQWRGKLRELQRDGLFALASTTPNILERLDRVFKKVYYSLTEEQQSMLLDLALYLPQLQGSRAVRNEQEHWLESAYFCKKKADEMLFHLVSLSIVEVTEGRIGIDKRISFRRVHDLLRDFVKKEIMEEEGTRSCKRIFKEHHTVNQPLIGPWLKAERMERIGISRCHFKDSTLDLSDIAQIEVLHLVHNEGLECVHLSGTAWSSLRSVVVETFTFTPIKIFIVTPVPKPQRWAFCVALDNCDFTASGIQKHPNSGLQCSNLVDLQLRNVQMDGLLTGVLNLEGLPHLQVLNLFRLPNLRINLELERCPKIRRVSLDCLPGLKAVSSSSSVRNLSIGGCNSLHALVLFDIPKFCRLHNCSSLESIEVRQSQHGDQSPEDDPHELCGSLSIFACPVVHIQVRHSRRKSSRLFTSFRAHCANTLNCSVETVKSMFEKKAGCCSEQEISSAAIGHFVMQTSTEDGFAFSTTHALKYIVLRHVHDTASYISALACTSASALQALELMCSREGGCGCGGPLQSQPRFDFLGKALFKLVFECTSVWDLSSLENCSRMEYLELCGCKSVVKWPDFGRMRDLRRLRIVCPAASLTNWPRGLRSLEFVDIQGSNQIPLEELVEVMLTGSNGTELPADDARLHEFTAAVKVLVMDFYAGRKGTLRIAKALMSSTGRILDLLTTHNRLLNTAPHRDNLFRNRYSQRGGELAFFWYLIQLLYGMWVEADCTLHECGPSCAALENTKGSQSDVQQLNKIQACLQGLLSHKAVISPLLRLIPRRFHYSHLPRNVAWSSIDFTRYFSEEFSTKAYESLVLVSCASIQEFGALHLIMKDPELAGQFEILEEVVDSFFNDWVLVLDGLPLMVREKYDALPLMVWERVPAKLKTSFSKLVPWITEHDLTAVRVADAMCRLGKALLEAGSTVAERHARMINEVEEGVRRTYGTCHSRASAHKLVRSHSLRKQWHHPVHCFCTDKDQRLPYQRLTIVCYPYPRFGHCELDIGGPLDKLRILVCRAYDESACDNTSSGVHENVLPQAREKRAWLEILGFFFKILQDIPVFTLHYVKTVCSFIARLKHSQNL